MYKREELYDILLSIIKEDRPHKDYKRTVEEAKWCHGTMTGDRGYEAVVSYRENLTEEEKKKVIKVYNSRTPEVAYGVEKIFNEVHRSDNVVDEIRYPKDSAPEIEEKLKSVLAEFKEAESFKEYLEEQLKFFTFHDPNAWLVFSFSLNSKGEQEIWPLEVPAAEAFNFERKRGTVQYFVLRKDIQYRKAKRAGSGIEERQIMEEAKDKKDPYSLIEYVSGFKYVLFAAGVTIEFRHIPADAIYSIPEGFQEVRLPIIREGREVEALFLYIEYPNNLERCPAACFGYFKDPVTRKRTFVSALYPARTIIQDLEIRKAEYDLSHACHGFFKEFIYVPGCKQCGGSGKIAGEPIRGENGERYVTDRDCPNCKGTGKLRHTSSMDVIEVKLPPDVKEIIPLQNLIYYAQIPEHLFRIQKEDWIEAKDDVRAAIFSRQIFDREAVAATATENKLNWRAAYNALQPYAKQYSKLYQWGVKMIAHIYSLDEGGELRVMHAFNPDFRLETVYELLEQRKLGKEVGAPAEVIRHIDLSLMAQQHKGEADFLKIQVAKEQFKPFRDKSETERTLLIGSLAKSHPLYIAWLYFEDIMTEIFVEKPAFHLLKYPEQKKIFEQILERYVQKEKKLVASFPTFGSAIIEGGKTKTKAGGNDSQENNGGEEEESGSQGKDPKEKPSPSGKK